MFEHIVKKRKTTKERKEKKNNKRDKIDQMRNYIVQINLIEKEKKILICSIILNVYALLDVSRVVDHHYYIDFEIERLVNDNLIVFINFIKLTRLVIVFDFNKKSIVIQQNDL